MPPWCEPARYHDCAWNRNYRKMVPLFLSIKRENFEQCKRRLLDNCFVYMIISVPNNVLRQQLNSFQCMLIAKIMHAICKHDPINSLFSWHWYGIFDIFSQFFVEHIENFSLKLKMLWEFDTICFWTLLYLMQTIKLIIYMKNVIKNVFSLVISLSFSQQWQRWINTFVCAIKTSLSFLFI